MPIGIRYEDRHEHFKDLGEDHLFALAKNDSTPEQYKRYAIERLFEMKSKKMSDPDVRAFLLTQKDYVQGVGFMASLDNPRPPASDALNEASAISESLLLTPEEFTETVVILAQEYDIPSVQKMDDPGPSHVTTGDVLEDLGFTPEELAKAREKRDEFVQKMDSWDEPLCTEDPSHCVRCTVFGECEFRDNGEPKTVQTQAVKVEYHIDTIPAVLPEHNGSPLIVVPITQE